MKTLLTLLALTLSLTSEAAVIRGQLARDLVSMMIKVKSVDLVAKDIRCTKHSNGIRATGHSCDLVVNSYKGEKLIRLQRSLAKQLWSELPGPEVQAGRSVIVATETMRCYTIERCDSLNLDCGKGNVCTLDK